MPCNKGTALEIVNASLLKRVIVRGDSHGLILRVGHSLHSKRTDATEWRQHRRGVNLQSQSDGNRVCDTHCGIVSGARGDDRTTNRWSSDDRAKIAGVVSFTDAVWVCPKRHRALHQNERIDG